MVDRSLRMWKARALAPLAGVASRRLGARAAMRLSAAAVVAGVASAALAAAGAFAWALALWLANRTLDGLDGEAARRQGRASDRGGYLDLVFDGVVYALVPIGAAWGRAAPDRIAADPSLVWTWVALGLLLGAYYVNLGTHAFLAALLEKSGRGAGVREEATSITMPAGLVEGAETVALVALMLAFPQALTAWFLLAAVAVVVTAVQRAAWASRHLTGPT